MKKGVLRFVFAILVIALVVIVGLILFLVFGGSGESGPVQPKVVDQKVEFVENCQDSDGYNIYRAGFTTFTDTEGRGSRIFDTCDYYKETGEFSRVGVVREATCELTELKLLYSTCGEGYICRLGECRKGDPSEKMCFDTDEGIRPNQRGEARGLGGFGEDSCYSKGALTNECSAGEDCNVYEYFCEGEYLKNQIILCPNGCKEAKCL